MDADIEAIARLELGTSPERVRWIEEGLLHETYELACDGREYVLQFVADTDDRRDSLRRGAYWYAALSGTSVPVPALASDGVGTYDGRAYVLAERCPGETAKRAVSPARTRRAGGCLARIHEARTFERAGWLRVADGTVSVDPFEASSHAAHVADVASESAATLREHGLAEAGTALAALVDRLATDLPAAVTPVLCHGDFSPNNVLFDGDALTGVVDFDRAHAGAAARDLARAGNAFWTHDPGADWSVRETLYEGYRSVRSPGERFAALEPLYRIETQAGAVAGMLELDALSASEREFYAEDLRETARDIAADE